ILVINIVGGFFVGVMQHGLSAGEAASTYTLLTIGDGLVAQVPALMLGVAAAVLTVMGVIPGMPNVAFLLLGAACAGAAWLLLKRERDTRAQLAEAVAEAPLATTQPERVELGWEDVASVDPLGLEVGYRLIPLVDTHQGGELMGRIKSVRRKLSQELGFLVPAVHI